MRKTSLFEGKGLSISQAQSLSNLCYQEARQIEFLLDDTNAYSKHVLIDGTKHYLQKRKELPIDVIDLLEKKSRLYACQAFLMENIKAKDFLLKKYKNDIPDLSQLTKPERPEFLYPEEKEFVSEEWGWEQLSVAEINEFLEAEAFAAHYGQFIHKESTLDRLREELSEMPDIEWIEINKDTKTPVFIHAHHTQDGLMNLHVKISKLHRKYEQRVNYFKSKVKNLVTEENRKRSEYNKEQFLLVEVKNRETNKVYEEKMKEYNTRVDEIKKQFEIDRNMNLKRVSSMRIVVDERFKGVVDQFLNELNDDGDA